MSVELRPCRQGWVFCDGNCEKCITIVTSTTTTNPEQFENCDTKHGRWIQCGDVYSDGYYECSECHKREWSDTDYCPNCGTRMDEVGNEAE